ERLPGRQPAQVGVRGEQPVQQRGASALQARDDDGRRERLVLDLWVSRVQLLHPQPTLQRRQQPAVGDQRAERCQSCFLADTYEQPLEGLSEALVTEVTQP